MQHYRVITVAVLLLVSGLALPPRAAAQGPAVISATLTDSFLTVLGERLTGASTVTLGGLAVGGITVNPAGTLLTGTLLGTLPDGSHLLSVTTAGVCDSPAPGADWVCTLAGGWVMLTHPLAATASMATVFVVSVGASGGAGVAGLQGPAGPAGVPGPAGAAGIQGVPGPAGNSVTVMGFQARFNQYGVVTSYVNLANGSLSSVESDSLNMMPTTCTFDRLYVSAHPYSWQDGPPLPGSVTYTLRKNGISQALSCSLVVEVVGGATASCSDTDPAHQFSVAPTDLVTIMVVNTVSAFASPGYYSGLLAANCR